MLNWKNLLVCISAYLNVTARLGLYEVWGNGVLAGHHVNEEDVEMTSESGPSIFEPGSGGRCKHMSQSLSLVPRGL